jgi:hypothetical protein
MYIFHPTENITYRKALVLHEILIFVTLYGIEPCIFATGIQQVKFYDLI